MVTGGDGVVPNALQVLAGTDIPLGIIPSALATTTHANSGFPIKNPRQPQIRCYLAGRKPLTWAGFKTTTVPKVVRHRGDTDRLWSTIAPPNALATRADALLHRDARRTAEAAQQKRN